MKRDDFLTKGILGIAGALGITALIGSDKPAVKTPKEACDRSPSETRGPFPNKNPAEYVRTNIIGDREGVPLNIELTVLNRNDSCKPLKGVEVDIWHCDNHGHYSEYRNFGMGNDDLTGKHFLRGRQRSNSEGQVQFTSIFPGYYRGRAPHIHVEISTPEGKSLLVTQIAFPGEICDNVYETSHYKGTKYISNESDSIFRSSLAGNMTDTIKGDARKGYTLTKKLIV